jgi:hypothetical protein
VLESWNMKKLLAILVLGLLFGGNLVADPYADPIYNNLNKQKNKDGTYSDPYYNNLNKEKKKYDTSSFDWIGSESKSSSSTRAIKIELAHMQIKKFCISNYPSNQKAYNRCKCGSLVANDIGIKCKDGWRERNKKIVKRIKKKEPKIDYTNCSIYHFIKYGCKNDRPK